MTQRPNILFFHLDNVSLGDFGCYGGGYPIGAKTPNIDRFAAESKMLTNYNVEAQCTPTRSALMTGRHSVRTGCISVARGSGIVQWELTEGGRGLPEGAWPPQSVLNRFGPVQADLKVQAIRIEFS